MKGLAKLACVALFCAAALLSGCEDEKNQTIAGDSATAEIFLSAAGQPIGTVFFTDTRYGLEVHTNLKNLPQGTLGFLVYEQAETNSICKEELPGLRVAANGRARNSLVIKGVRMDDFRDCELVIRQPVQMAAVDGADEIPLRIASGMIRKTVK